MRNSVIRPARSDAGLAPLGIIRVVGAIAEITQVQRNQGLSLTAACLESALLILTRMSYRHVSTCNLNRRVPRKQLGLILLKTWQKSGHLAGRPATMKTVPKAGLPFASVPFALAVP
jgi:hypothetical protein